MSEYRQDDTNDGYCPICTRPLRDVTVTETRGYCDRHGWQYANWGSPPRCAICGQDGQWNDAHDENRCPEHWATTWRDCICIHGNAVTPGCPYCDPEPHDYDGPEPDGYRYKGAGRWGATTR
jgi:hypothetical protein